MVSVSFIVTDQEVNEELQSDKLALDDEKMTLHSQHLLESEIPHSVRVKCEKRFACFGGPNLKLVVICGISTALTFHKALTVLEGLLDFSGIIFGAVCRQAGDMG